jgi:hypothetical protein
MAISGLTPKPSKADLAKYVNLSIIKRELCMHLMSEEDIEGLANSGDGLHLAFLGMSVGCFITLLATVFTVQFSNPWTHATFFVGSWVSAFITLFFVFKVARDRVELNKKLKKFKSSPIEIPLEIPQGKELSQSVTPRPNEE